MMKRLYLGILAVAVTAALTTVGSLALFSSDPDTTTADFTAGTVSLGAPSTRLADVTGIAPGDSATKTYQVTYTGSLAAWVGLDASLSGDLTTCDGGGKFTVAITDEKGVSYDSNTDNQVVVNGSGTKAALTNGYSKTFNVTYDLALNAGNDCQGKTATISLTTHAVQSKNNTNGTNDGPVSWN